MNIEKVQDIVGAMVTGNTEAGISVTYDDPAGKLNFQVAGVCTFLDLSSVSCEFDCFKRFIC